MKARKTRKAVVTLLVLVGLFGFLTAATAGDLQPPAAPGSTMKTLDEVEPRIPISQADIPKTISSSGSYYLTEDVNISAAGIAITVDANDVTIDLAGFVLSGPDLSSYGIYMNGRSNVEIRNGTVRDFLYGIFEVNASGQDHRVIDVRALSNGRYGIYLAGSGHLVKDCTASDNGDSATVDVYGIYTGSGSTVTGSMVRNNGTSADGFGVYGIYTGSGCTVSGNTSYDNGNSATGSLVVGISVGSGSTVTGNTVHSNGISATGTVFGIQLGPYNLVDQNTAYSNNGTNMILGVAGCVYGVNVAP